MKGEQTKTLGKLYFDHEKQTETFVTPTPIDADTILNMCNVRVYGAMRERVLEAMELYKSQV